MKLRFNNIRYNQFDKYFWLRSHAPAWERYQLTRQQQINILAGKPFDSVLGDKQKKYLNWRKKLRGEISEDTNIPLCYIHTLLQDGCLTLQFKIKAVAPQWFVHVYIHPTVEHTHKYHGSRSKREIGSGLSVCLCMDIPAKFHLIYQ